MSVKRYVNVDELFKTYPFTRCGGPLTDYAEGYLDCVEEAKESINNLATLDVEEVRHGEWLKEHFQTLIPVEYDVNGQAILHDHFHNKCSLCGRLAGREEPYCHCGAKMDGGKK